jgi:hypothetical protein
VELEGRGGYLIDALVVTPSMLGVVDRVRVGRLLVLHRMLLVKVNLVA